MNADQIASRIRNRVRPRLGVRLIPKRIYAGWLGRRDRLYVCLGDYDEFCGLTVGDAADRLYGGLEVKGKRSSIAWHYEPSLDGGSYLSAATAEEYYVLTVALDDEAAVDLFPGTWKAIAYIATDPDRMRARSDIREQLLALHAGATPFETREKAAIDFLEYHDPGNEECSRNVQARYYAYLTCDSGYGNTVLEPFGVHNRCWHGRGYVGAFGELWCRIFLSRNLPGKHAQIVSCDVRKRQALLPTVQNDI
jgi:hypothetical protein